MYRYSEAENLDKLINLNLNSLFGNIIYRVQVLSLNMLVITFYNNESKAKFTNKYITKYTCDTSSIEDFGLSILISDESIISTILDPIINEIK